MQTHNWVKTLELPNFRFCNDGVKQEVEYRGVLMDKCLPATGKPCVALPLHPCLRNVFVF